MNKHVWNSSSLNELFKLGFFDLIEKAYKIHKKNFHPADMEYCTLLSIKTGACPEDCAYCPQSGHYNTGLKKQPLIELRTIVKEAQRAKQHGSKRFCMGAAWKSPPKKDLSHLVTIIKEVKKLGLETCMTLGMLTKEQAKQLQQAGLDYYNHNIDTSKQFYRKIISTRSYQDRLDTLQHVIDAGMNVCCGGILGMGETRQDRIDMLLTLNSLKQTPKSIPLNKLITIEGTPLEHAKALDHFEFIRTIAITRIMFPQARIRLAAGRESMSEEAQAWCYMAGANSIFIGDILLTAANPAQYKDTNLLEKLAIKPPQTREFENYVKQ